MKIEEIKEEINLLTNEVTEDNVQGIVSTLNGLVGFILEKFKSPLMAEKFNQFPGKVLDKIKTFESDYQLVSSKVEVNHDLSKQKEEIERKFTQITAEYEKLNELETKCTAIRELANIQNKVGDLTRVSKEEMNEQISSLKILNDVLADANTDLENSFAIHVLTLERNLASIQSKRDNILEKLNKSSIERFGKEFLESVNSLESDYNTYAALINLHKDKQAQIIALYKEHHSENENIFKALKGRIKDLKSLDILNHEIRERLQYYDDEIRKLIENRDKMPIFQLEELSKCQ